VLAANARRQPRHFSVDPVRIDLFPDTPAISA